LSRFEIRPAVEADLPSIVQLFPRAFGKTAPGPGFSDHVGRVLFHHPWTDLGLKSLACEGPDGRLIGFLGVLPRRMRAGGRPLTLAISHHFMVDPDHRKSLAGVALLKSFLSGPQDLSMCEPDEQVGRLWEGLGGAQSHLHSFTWVRYLRPALHLARRVSERWPGFLAPGFASSASLLDGAVRRLSHLPVIDPGCSSEDLPLEGLLGRIDSSARGRYLRPDYALEDLTWLFDLLAGKKEQGRLRCRVVGDEAGQTLGHFVYYSRRGGAGEVLQVGAEPGRMNEVVDALFHDALTEGVPAVAGRLDPAYTQPLSDRNAIFRCRANRVVYATSRPDLERAILGGDAFLTRFELEWWIPFGGDAT
jgi:Acetyltransferase (GNAT) domain